MSQPHLIAGVELGFEVRIVELVEAARMIVVEADRTVVEVDRRIVEGLRLG